ncbi:hypothetical protein [Gallaecimonas xiamenensis]|uniref:hypothetical protein n=1 Tax=Gallaecimonas xiamenensis TaxID=1207039 RepID=UPI0012E9D9F0|nr:hypothetical protein [Gallaecimonas xiamenensis]
MNIYEEEIEGREFDWYAIDDSGNIALFSTAGEGSIPKLVIENYKHHDEISDSIDAPNWGSPEVWGDYAKLGFFVFDWDLPGGPYLRECSPTNTMNEELKKKILSINSLPVLDVNFSKVEKINNV